MKCLYERLSEYGKQDFYPCHMPGHKRRMSGSLPPELIEADITEIDGFDNLHQPEGLLLKLQRQAATVYGAEESYYLVNGSTCGVLAAVSAALPVGGHLLMARNCHKSAYHAAYLRSLTISYLYPKMLKEYDIFEAVTPDQIREALEAEPNIGAVLVVSPTYEGRISDIGRIAEVVHAHGIPLIVDEAHGAHLGFAPEFAPGSCTLGADYVIHSVHKTLPAMTQTALLHISGPLADKRRLRRFLSVYQTSSPSYVLMASIDNALRQAQDRECWKAFISRWERMLNRLGELKKLRILTGPPEIQDVGKLTVSTGNTGLSGTRLYDMLLQRYYLQLEMAAESYCLAMFTVGDTQEGFERMAEALLCIDRELADKPEGFRNETVFDGTDGGAVLSGLYEPAEGAGISGGNVKKRPSLPLSAAWELAVEELPLERSAFRYAGEFIGLYPPGSPLAVPGEILTPWLLQRIRKGLEMGLHIQGVRREGGLELVWVLREDMDLSK